MRVHSAPSFAAQWLTPRLAQFLAAHPKLEVRLSANTDNARFTNDDFDIDIVYGEPPAEGVEIVLLAEDTITPLCSPALAATIKRPSDLLARTLIRSDVKQIQWHQWLAANGLESPALHGMRFDRSFLALATAAEGLGVALERPCWPSVSSRQVGSSRRWPAAPPTSVMWAIAWYFPATITSARPCAPLPTGSPRAGSGVLSMLAPK